MNKPLALALGQMVQVAYAQYDGTTASLPESPRLVIEETLTVHEGGKQVPFGFIATSDNMAFVVLRGTSSLLEWMDDAFIMPTLFPGYGDVASGMNDLYRQLAPQIIKTLTRVKAGHIYLTGHSLGAALVHLAAADILHNLGVKAESYTFCGPRVGDPAFARSFADAGLVTWRFFNTEDIVPTVPLATVPFSVPAGGFLDRLVSFFGLPASDESEHGEFEHVGTPLALTFHAGSLAGNHDLANLLAAHEKYPS